VDAKAAIVWGLVATILQTTLEVAGQRLGVSRMSLPFLLGTMLTSQRDRAQIIGLGLHVANGWVFGLLYAMILERMHRRAGWLVGGITGCLHALFLLIVGMDALQAIHPRMASEDHGPTPTRQLEPPGFLALHYGRRTPLLVVAGHVLYGMVFGALYCKR
jgi:uncharacterized membrane protein YagU involved in acid resistance